MNRLASVPSKPDDGRSVADEALQWFVLLRSGNATRADRRQFNSWITADACRRREFDKLSELWVDLDAAQPVLHDELIRLALEWKASGKPLRSWHTWRWNSGRWSTAVATLLVVVMAGGWWFANRVEVQEYRTAKGERRSVVMADGSMITMNTDTVLRTELSRSRRAVVLREGEALFAVAHEPARPFEVLPGQGVVRDVGTQFVVRRQDQHVVVTVVEGAVEVQPVQEVASIESRRMLTAGEQVSYRHGGPLSQINRVSLAAATAWVEGKVMFEDRPLSEVIHEVGRYQAGEIRILDPHIGALKVSGVFGINDRQGFLTALEQAVPVAVSRVNRNLVIVERKADAR